MRAIVYYLIGRVSIEIWLALTPVQRDVGVATLAAPYCEQMQCHKASILIETEEKSVSIYIQCEESET